MTVVTPADVSIGLRAADQVLDPADMGGAWPTRHSFSRTLVRRAATHHWHIDKTREDLDEDGRGSIVYTIRAEGHTFSFLVLSQTIAEADRTDRVIATAWDVSAALVDGELTPSTEESLRFNAPRQEAGRFGPEVVIVTRANRSARFFDYVVDTLADGHQPDPDVLGPSPYLLRSTAYYGNGKFGLREFSSLPEDHPLAVPYRSQMLAAWLLRESSIDIVEHVARVRASQVGRSAVSLDPAWCRYLGIGNATGLGMVPFVINHPQILDAWALLREFPLAQAMSRAYHPDDPQLEHVARLLSAAQTHLGQKRSLKTAPFCSPDALSMQLEAVCRQLDEFRSGGLGSQAHTILFDLHETAARISPEARGIVAAIVTEIDSGLDMEVEHRLRVEALPDPTSSLTCGELLRLVHEGYGWALQHDFAAPDRTAYYWYTSLDSEEPRRARRDAGATPVEHCTDIARRVVALAADLAAVDPDLPIADFLIGHPLHRFAATRVQQTRDLPYGRLRVNLLDADFLPLNVQRFQLACYGMINYSPQSTDWLRVTLFSGAPRATNIMHGAQVDDWLFPLTPSKENAR